MDVGGKFKRVDAAHSCRYTLRPRHHNTRAVSTLTNYKSTRVGDSNSLAGKVRQPRGTPLRRNGPVKQGVCGEVKVKLRRPAKPKGQVKRTSVIEQKNVEVPSSIEGYPPTNVIIKTNPLFRPTTSGVTETVESEKIESNDPAFYGQRRFIRKTKEQEMISAIMDLAKSGEKNVGTKKSKKSLLQKVKAFRHRKRTGGIEKQRSPMKKGGAFVLRKRK